MKPKNALFLHSQGNIYSIWIKKADIVSILNGKSEETEIHPVHSRDLLEQIPHGSRGPLVDQICALFLEQRKAAAMGSTAKNQPVWPK